ncbi:MAG: sugar transferase [Acidobacteriaceae bacterium]|nr:sugar transferase [Acidobacteriaceae bacterium]
MQAVVIALESGFPVFFSQIRIGRNGRPFRLWKFRTMRTGQPGLPITWLGDSRITRVGSLVRKTKMDELPQLLNILSGRMSFVGPRPEIPAFVDTSSELWRAVLRVRPGLVDPAYLQMPEEIRLLASYDDPLAAYRNIILPRKLMLARQYIVRQTVWSDLRLLLHAAWAIFAAEPVHLEP